MDPERAIRSLVGLTPGAGGRTRHLTHSLDGRLHPIDRAALEWLVGGLAAAGPAHLAPAARRGRRHPLRGAARADRHDAIDHPAPWRRLRAERLTLHVGIRLPACYAPRPLDGETE